MLRVVIALTVLGLSATASPPLKYLKPEARRNSYSKPEVVRDSRVRNLSQASHVRYAPQDPVVIAGEYGGELRIEGHHRTAADCDRNCDQDNSAHYAFDASIKDEINDLSHDRSETRDGLKVTGMYSFSDGYFHRTVHYIADENGYRITKQEVKKIGDGPIFNPEGQADVQGSLIGGYSIVIDDSKQRPSYVDIKTKQH